MTTCTDFRRRLLQAVLDHEALKALAWDPHGLACPACRALVDSEEQLDALLEAWSAPRLDAATRARIVALVAQERGLDQLLEADLVRAPQGMAQRAASAVRARLAQEAAEDALDRLLDLDQVHAPAGLTKGLAARVRAAARPTQRLRLVRYAALVATAAAVLVFVYVRRDDVRPSVGPNTVDPAPLVAQLEASAVDERMLQQLELLEDVDALLEGDLDLLLSTMDASEEALLDLAPMDATPSDADASGEAPSKG
jgi:hypothetical protein